MGKGPSHTAGCPMPLTSSSQSSERNPVPPLRLHFPPSSSNFLVLGAVEQKKADRGRKRTERSADVAVARG